MKLATQAQIQALNKVFAPCYSEWKKWANENLPLPIASEMIGRVHGYMQMDYQRGKPEAVAAFEGVRMQAYQLGYRKWLMDRRTAADFKNGDVVKQWTVDGIPCFIRRNRTFCGYIGVPKHSRSFAFKDYDSVDLDVHGGLTFGADGEVCSSPEFLKDFYWYGWDYAHLGDAHQYDVPQDLKDKHPGLFEDSPYDKHWTVGEVALEVENAAREAARRLAN